MSRSILRRLAICLAVVSLLVFAAFQPAIAQDSNPHAGEPHDHARPAAAAPAAENQEHAHTGAFPISQQLMVLAFYSIVIAAASLVGGWLPGRISLSHVSFQILVSLVGGLMIGIAVLHLLPHAIHELGVARIDLAAQWTLAGILLMFVLLRTLHVHHHDPSAPTVPVQPVIQEEHDHDHDHDCGHDHSPAPALVSHDACAHQHGSSGLSWLGAALGLGIHTVMDGLALGAAMRADAGHANSFGLFGLGIFLAVALHKPLDSLSITTMMVAAGQSPTARLTVNILYALLCPLGAALVIVGAGQPGPGVQLIIGASLAFSAGVFLCIALADLLPEMQFHSHNQFALSAALLAGVVLAWAVGFLEPAHLHH